MSLEQITASMQVSNIQDYDVLPVATDLLLEFWTSSPAAKTPS